MAEDSTRFRAERTVLRRLFTINAKLVEAAFESVPVDMNKVNSEFAKLADKADRLFALDSRMSEALFGDVKFSSDENELNKEFEGVEQYREIWVSIVSRREGLLDKQAKVFEAPGSVTSSPHSDGLKLKLPKLDLRQFDIKPETWIAFWAAFKRIDEREDIDAEDKFQLLLRMAREGTVAKELLDGYPPSAENYPKALAHLKQRFGRDELLIEHNVRELLGLVLVQAKGQIGVADLRPHCDKLEAKLMVLESLGVTSDRFSCILMPLVESSLPEGVLRAWEKARPSDEDAALDSVRQMEQLRAFLKKTVITEERVVLARSTFTTTSAPGGKSPKQDKKPTNEKKVPTATDLVSLDRSQPTEDKSSCVFCSGNHFSEYCRKAREMDSDARLKVLKDKNMCFRCLKRYHVGRRCRTTPHCLVCSKPHATSMCAEPVRGGEVATSTPIEEKNLSNTTFTPVLMQTLQVRVISSNRTPVTARVLLDTGSQRSYISRQLAEKMGYESQGMEKIVHALFGGDSTGVKTHQRYKARLEALSGQYRCNFDVLDTETICQTVPAVPKGPWSRELREKNIVVSDTSEGPVDLLIGSDVAGKLFTGKKSVLSCGLVAMETSLGWILMGRIRDGQTDTMLNVTSLCAVDLSPAELWKLDIIGINDPADISTQEEARTAARNHFLKTVKILDNGRYEVSLPWVVGHPILPQGLQQATSRLESTVRKLRADGLFEAYDEVFKEWLHDGLIEEVAHENWDSGHYLQHRAVVKEGSTTRLRPVFDASAGKPNLNQCLEKGDNLIELIPSVLLRFRIKGIGIISDVRRAFLQISVDKKDRDYLRFWWVDNSGEVETFRHTRVVFGVTSSPYLLASVINHHLARCEEKANDGGAPYDVSTVSQFFGSLYVDNCVTSVQNQEDLETFVRQAKAVFLEACFDLRGWEWTDPSLTNGTKTPVLGILWDRKSDFLKIRPPTIDEFEDVTRSIVMSASQRLYDPLGACAPAMLIPRLIIQESWKEGGTWDTPLSDKNQKLFAHWLSEIHALYEIEIPRWIKVSMKESDVTLHTFCDASQSAFATVSYLRVENAEGVFVTEVAAKSRVAPLKRVTIPRLELLAATIGSRLASNILKEVRHVKTYFWTDSTTVLSWIRREEPWGVFVYNRVREIRSLALTEDWHHVPGTQNPADLASRGCSPKTLLASSWWEGPDWLREPVSDWPSVEELPNEEEILNERRKKAIITGVGITTPENLTSADFEKFEKHSRNVKVIGWILRFLFNKFSKKTELGRELSCKEIERAETFLFAMVQSESFSGVKDTKLSKLKPRVGNGGKCGLVLLRTANGRLTRAIQHVYPMEIAAALDPEEDPQEVPAQVPVSDEQDDPVKDPGPLSPLEDSVPLMQPKDSESLSVPQETLKKKPRIPKQKSVEKVCETRCRRIVKLPIKFAV